MDEAEKTWREAKLEEALYRAKESSDREYKLRQALLFYARTSNYPGGEGLTSVLKDGGERARKALEG